MRNKYLVVVIALAACSQGKDAAPPAVDAAPAAAATVVAPEGAAVSTRDGELPSWQIPNMGEAAEAYYGPDSVHLIAQVRNSKALKSSRGGDGFLTTTFTDAGDDIVLVNDKGYDACSYFFPDGERLIWTSVRDHLGDGKTLEGDWSDWDKYPQGAELYISDRQGGDVKRLTDNNYYEAEVTVSPDGKWIVFGRQIDGNMDLWVMNADGSGEKQITFTEDWQEGAPYFLPDSETILFRAWKASEYGQRPTPMTIFTIKRDGSGLEPQTHTHEMNWAPYPAPDGKHFVYVRIEPNSNNWEVYLGEIGAGPDAAPRRLTFDDGFDGFPSISPDGRKLVWTTNRSDETKAFMQNLRLHVMDITSLGIGPK
jgi:Tol biopolymer transport system component